MAAAALVPKSNRLSPINQLDVIMPL